MKIQYNILGAVILILFNISAFGNNEYDKSMLKEVNLNGLWKFTIINYEGWEAPEFNDSEWEELRVPGAWEDQGYNGYNGYGYYRKEVTIPKQLTENQLHLMLGYIDDVDEVYFNGKMIGSSGSFPPRYRSSWESNRSYLIPSSLINRGGKNTIAVKVFDMAGLGGITKGDIGIYIQEFPIKPKIDLVGEWKFKIRNDDDYRLPDFDDSGWDIILAPAIWENQGYKDYNGTAWYRKEFEYNGGFDDEFLVFLAGKIDDVDQVFINGKWIGQTGHDQYFKTGRIVHNYYYMAERGYVFPASLLKTGRNVVAIQVIDGGGSGGIYDGPLGIIKQADYIEYWKKRSKNIRDKTEHKW